MQSLEDDDLHNFTNYISAAQESGADLNHQYGGESGYKTILHLALEEDDGLPYVEELLKVRGGENKSGLASEAVTRLLQYMEQNG